MNTFLGLIVIALIIGVLGYRIVTGGRDLAAVVKDGVDTKGTVIKKSRLSGGPGAIRHYLSYRYTDAQGMSHEHTSIADEIFDKYQEGDQIDITYSASRPSASVPKYRADRARAAMKKG